MLTNPKSKGGKVMKNFNTFCKPFGLVSLWGNPFYR